MVIIKCPACTRRTKHECAVCHGRGTVRTWYVAFTTDGLTVPSLLPIGVELESVTSSIRGFELDRPRYVARVERHKLTEAIDVIVSAFGGLEHTPIVHKARHSPIDW